MKKHNILALILMITLLTSCAEKETETLENVSAAVETTEITETEISSSYVDESGSLYVKVTDWEGIEKLIYYEMPPEKGYEPYVHMEEVTDNPESRFGYASVISYEAPAMETEAYLGEKISELIEQSHLSSAEICCFKESDEPGIIKINRADNPEEFVSVIEMISALEPEYAEELNGAVITAPNSDYPITGISFGRENAGFSSHFCLKFGLHNDRVIGQISVEDYSEIINLVLSENQPPKPAEIEEAYNSSVGFVSEWFYINNTDLYDYCLKYAAGFDSNIAASAVDKISADFSTDSFSAEIAQFMAVSGIIPNGYTDVSLGKALFAVPKNGNQSVIGSMFLWENDGLTLKIIQNTDVPDEKSAEVYNGSFCGNKCIYYEAVSGDECEINLWFLDYEGVGYNACFTFSGNDKSAAETARIIMGSIHLEDKPEDEPYVPLIALSNTPSIYGDENYKLAEAELAYRSFRADAPALVGASFYVLDSENNYETGFECFIEKLEPDGKWYAVKPLAEIVQANSGRGHFYSESETGRKYASIDLACYPLLPSGKYRLVKPFCREGSDDVYEYAALFDFTMSDDISPQKELLCTAECEEKIYSPDTESITYILEANKALFATSDIVDIEKKTGESWKSVRTGKIHTNSLHASYTLAIPRDYTVDTNDFDISNPGEYRIRISYADSNGAELRVSHGGYDTAYAYFEVK